MITNDTPTALAEPGTVAPQTDSATRPIAPTTDVDTPTPDSAAATPGRTGLSVVPGPARYLDLRALIRSGRRGAVSHPPGWAPPGWAPSGRAALPSGPPGARWALPVPLPAREDAPLCVSHGLTQTNNPVQRGRVARAGNRPDSSTPDIGPLRTVHAVPVIVPDPRSAARVLRRDLEVNP